jgi:hypothetical protein
MSETTVNVMREQNVDADPEMVWGLVASPAALSAMPGQRFAFPVPTAIPGTDRLCCVIFAVKGGAHCAVFDVREEIPGQSICWQLHSTPAAKETLTLSVRPRPGGCTVGVAVSRAAQREAKIRYEDYWGLTARAWARRLKAVVEGREPAPPAGIPAALRAACAAYQLPKKTLQASASVLVNADADIVWETVWAPESSRLIDPERVVWAGTVPGTPQRALGEMQCTLRRPPDGRLRASVVVVRELTEGRRALTQTIGSPAAQVLHLLTPVPGGTRLDLTSRWLPQVVKKVVKRKYEKTEMEGSVRHLQTTVEGYKALAEKAAGIL